MFKKLFLIFLVIFSTTSVFAQVAADPNDSFYEDALRWELQGLVPTLPKMRPYSLQLVKNILETVMQSEDALAAEEASEYYEEYFGKFLRFGVETSVYTEIKDGKLEKQLDINPLVYGNAEVLPNTTVSFEATPMLSTALPREGLIPKYTAPKYDSISDSLFVSKFNLYTPYNAVVAFGSNDIYFQVGLNRNSFGCIPDTGVVLSSTAPHVGSLVFTINKKKFNYQLAMLLLSASNSLGQGRYPSKYFYFHSLRYSFTNKFDFTIYETAITGPRFDFTYLMPIVPFMGMQQISGYASDNLLIGIELVYKPVNGLRLFFNGYADDIGFNDLVKLKLNTKLKMAIETGVQYAPLKSNLCKFISFDYTFLAPYMYSHEMKVDNELSIKTPNYQNYTSGNVSLGALIPPNSDQLRFNIEIKPVKDLALSFNSTIIRHGNINETYYKKGIQNNSIIDQDAYDCLKSYLISPYQDLPTDGSIFDFPNATGNYFNYPNSNFLFLDNTTNYICFQNSINSSYTLLFKNKSSIVFGVNYTLQYEKNVGVGTNIFTKVDGFTDKTSKEEIISELNNQYDKWKLNLTDQFSNFLSFSVKYVY